MNVALVDDCQKDLDYLSTLLLQKLGNHISLHIFHSGKEFLSFWKPGSYDLVILDILMDTLTGIDIAREIRKIDSEVRLVFCTASNEFASESYEVNAHFYLRKPYSQDQADTMLSRLNLQNYELRRSVTLPDGQQIILRNIIYTEYSNHVLTIHSKQRNDVRSYISQSNAEALFCAYPYFLVCSKGIIVNLHEVDHKMAGTFHMSDGTILPISRRKSKEVQDAYAAFCFAKMREEVPL